MLTITTCFFFVLTCNGVFCDEVTTVNSEPNKFITPPTNNNLSFTISFGNETSNKDAVKSERAVQPVSQTQNVSGTAEFKTTDNGTKDQTNDLQKFRPSPQLESFYEFNKVPVRPVIGEHKFLRNIQTGDGQQGAMPAWETHNQIGQGQNQGPNQVGQGRGSSWSVNVPWAQNNNPSQQVRPWNHQDSTSDSPWINRVKFPSSVERPYSFVNNQQNIGESNENYNRYLPPRGDRNPPVGEHSPNKYLPPSGGGGGTETRYPPSIRANVNNYLSPNEDSKRNQHLHSTGIIFNQAEPFAFNKPVEIPRRVPSKQYDYFNDRRPSWEKYGGEKEIPYLGHHKGSYDYNSLEKPASSQKTYDYGHHDLSDGHHGFNPIQKILKLLATFIPIGLLISALTPTVITVTNVNDTTATDVSDPMRYRSEDPKKALAQHVISTLGYFDKLNEQGCEYRVFCELLISASNMKDSEQHVENLLSNFSNEEKHLKDKADVLRKVFEAVKNQDCSPIRCKYLKGPS